MDWFEPLNHYCERTGPGFWAEPFNAWTNLAFWLAAAAVWPAIRRLDRSIGRPVWSLWLLNLLLIGIGAGSFAFHTVAVVWAAMLDVGFIALWVFWFVPVYLRRVVGWPTWAAVLGDLGLAAAIVVSTAIGQNFIAVYFPALGLAIAFGLWGLTGEHRRQGSELLVAAGCVFAVSMFAAAIDHTVCEVMPIGTHFIWHTLNGVVLYLTTLAIVRGWQTP